MKNAKKILSFVLSIAMLLSVMQVGSLIVFADELTAGKCGESVTYSFDSSTGTLTISGTGPMTDYADTESPFFCNDSIKSVVINYGVTKIGNAAFRFCFSLESVTLPNSLISIGEVAFVNCCLKSLVLPNSVTTISKEAFSSAFSDEFTSITIPAGVKSIGYCAFRESTAKSIEVNSNNPNYSSQDGVLFNKNKTVLVQYPIGNTRTSYNIPNSVKTISDWSFSSAESIKSVIIPDSVTIIGEQAFESCINLIDISIPDSVERIGNNAFDYTGYYNDNNNWDTDALYVGNHLVYAELSITGDYIVKPGTVTIADYSFYKCSDLISVTIPKSVKFIGYSAFFRMLELNNIYYEGTKKNWEAIIKDDLNDELITHTIHCSDGDYTEAEESSTPEKEPSVPNLKNNSLTVKAKKPTVKYSKLKKKTQTIALKKWATVTKAKGKVSYKLTSAKKGKKSFKKYFKIAKNGKITVKKGLKKGTYKAKIKVKAAGDATYKSKTVTVTVTIKVK